MKTSMTKALLLSALVFPGVGQIHLKRFKTGIALIAIIIICFFIMVTSVMNTAMTAMQQIQLQGDIVDMQKITQIATDTTENATNFDFNLALILIVICWLYSIVDVIVACKKSSPVNH